MASPPEQPRSFELVLGEGLVETVELRSADQVPDAVDAILARHADLAPEAAEDIEMALWEQWFKEADRAVMPYQGMSPPAGEELAGCIASVSLPAAGLVLEVAPSLAAPDAGLGLFVRCTEDEVILDRGTAVCGYAAGSLIDEARQEGKTVAFALTSPDNSVWFEKELRSAGEVLELEDVDAIAGHIALADGAGRVERLELEADFSGPRYFVPHREQPQPLDVLSLGQMANDLAVGASTPSADEYEALSEESNLLVLVWRLERDDEQPGLLVPSRPISTLARSVKFTNKVAMEVGCRYGERFWSNLQEQET